MVRKLITIMILSMMVLIFPQMATAESTEHIYDEAGLIPETDYDRLNKIAEKYSSKNEIEYIFISTDDPANDITRFMGDYYDDKGFGYEKEHGSAAILALNIATRDVQLAGFVDAEEKLDDKKMGILREQITPTLSDGDYSQAFIEFMEKADIYTKYRKNVNPESIFYKTTTHLVLALLLGLIIVFGMSRNMGMKVTVNARTYHDDSETIVHGKRDRYIRTTVTRRRKPKPKKSSGGGGGMTGGGRSFSGSRGKF